MPVVGCTRSIDPLFPLTELTNKVDESIRSGSGVLRDDMFMAESLAMPLGLCKTESRD